MSNNRYSFSEETIQHLDFKLLYISASKYEGEWQSNPHTHHFSELFYVTHGKGELQIEDKRFPIRENDFIIVNPHIEHTEFSTGDTPLEYIVFGLEGITFSFDKKFQDLNYALYNYDTQKDKILFMLNTLLAEAYDQNPNYELVCRNLTEILMVYLVRKQHLGLHQSLDTKMSKECGVAKRYIDSNYMDNITLDLLAELTHMNKFYLVHSFTKYTGLSPINYLTQRRIQVAMDLLSSTDYSIAQIASSVGFSSQSYFSQVFRKALALTPVQYRKQHIRDISPLKNTPLASN